VQKIKVSLSGNGRSVVTEGLKPGQKVVAEGQYRVQDGTLVADRQNQPVQQAEAERR
jgi:multidrug efflux system membrane fusion protein